MDGIETVITHEYNENDELVQTITTQNDTSTTVQYTYTLAGNRTEAVNGAASITYQYNDNNQIIEVIDQEHTTTFQYDDNGNRIKEVRDDNKVKTYTYDGLDRLVQVTDFDGTLIQYSYDGLDNRETESVITTRSIPESTYVHRTETTLPETGHGEIIENKIEVQESYTYINDVNQSYTQVPTKIRIQAMTTIIMVIAANTAVASYGGALVYSTYEYSVVDKQKGKEDLAKTVVSALTSGIGSSINITPGKTGSLDITSDGSVVLRSTVNGGITLNGNLVLNSAVTGAIADVNAALSDNGTSVSMSKGNDTATSTQAETLDEFYERVKKLSPSERAAEYRVMADKVAKEKGFSYNRIVSQKNKRIIYYDYENNAYYSLDTLHGTFEKCNIKGKHLGKFRFDFVQLEGPDLSGNHDIRIK